MYDKTKVFPIREPEGGGGGGGDVTAAGNNTFTGVNTFENNVNLGKSDSIITVNGILKDGDGNEYVTTTDVATKNSTGVVQIGDYIDVDENGVISSNDTRKASIEDLETGKVIPYMSDYADLADNLTPYSEDSGIKQTQPFFLEGTATGNGESRVDAKQVPAYAFLQEKRGNMVCVNQLYGGDSDYTETLGTGLKFSYSASTGLVTLNGTSTSLAQEYIFGGRIVKGHNNLAIMRLVSGSFEGGDPRIMVGGSGAYSVKPTNSPVIINVPTAFAPTANLQFFANADSVFTNAVFQIIFVDLTKWFNGNIPPYLLSHPEAFGRYYKGSLAYETGRLEPATGRYLTSVGRNLYDGEHDVEVSPSTTYYCYGLATITYKDVDGESISDETLANGSFNTPSNCYSIGISAQTPSVTISQYYPGESGYDKYYPYEVLATIDTGSEDLLAFDVKYPNGLIERNTLNKTYNGGNYESWVLQGSSSSAVYSFGTQLTNVGDEIRDIRAICDKLIYKSGSYSTETIDCIYSQLNASGLMLYVRIKEATTVEEFRTWLASNNLHIQIETNQPTTEQGTPFQENVPIDDFGQLSWSDTNVPQGNQIFYPVDYKAYEDTLIKYTDGDATSLVRKTDYASSTGAGVVKIDTSKGIGTPNSDGTLYINAAGTALTKEGTNSYQPTTPRYQHQSTFYGLSRAAGVNLASSTEETAPDGTNPGVYPAAAKTAIQNMLGITDLIGDINTVLDSVNGVVI